MNKDEVIALAEKCKLAVLIHSQWTHEIKEFTVVDYVVEGDLGSLMQFAKLVADAEREACARVVENILLSEGADVDDVLLCLAEDIRARGQA
jgi:hypothetical protein